MLVAERGRDGLLGAQPRRLSRGVFRSMVDLPAAINRYIEGHNAAPKPFVWTVAPELILGNVARGTRALASLH